MDSSRGTPLTRTAEWLLNLLSPFYYILLRLRVDSLLSQLPSALAISSHRSNPDMSLTDGLLIKVSTKRPVGHPTLLSVSRCARRGRRPPSPGYAWGWPENQHAPCASNGPVMPWSPSALRTFRLVVKQLVVANESFVRSSSTSLSMPSLSDPMSTV